MPIRLQHLHLSGLTPYSHASRLQSLLVSQFLSYKALASSSTPPLEPLPTILTFTPPPTYTVGRRDETQPSLTPAQISILKAPFITDTAVLDNGNHTNPLIPEFHHAQRGGLITFHGPGQLVVYPILSLSRPYSFKPTTTTTTSSTRSQHPQQAPAARTSLTPRCYVNLLEATTISTLSRFGISGIRTENPGVWRADGEEKIAALGVHLRRNVTSHGVGLNVSTDLRWFRRIVACGLEGKGVTSMQVEMGSEEVPSLEEVAGLWVSEFAMEVGVLEEEIGMVKEEDILALGGKDGG